MKRSIISHIAKATAASLPVFAALTWVGVQAADGAPAASYNSVCSSASTTATWSHPPEHVVSVQFVWRDIAGTIMGNVSVTPRGHSVSMATPSGATLSSVSWFSNTRALAGTSNGCSA